MELEFELINTFKNPNLVLLGALEMKAWNEYMEENRIGVCEGMRNIKQYISNGDLIYISKKNEIPLGFIIIQKPNTESKTAKIEFIFVNPKNRREHIGTHLIDYVLSELKKNEIESVERYVDEDNELGYNFVISQGVELSYDLTGKGYHSTTRI